MRRHLGNGLLRKVAAAASGAGHRNPVRRRHARRFTACVVSVSGGSMNDLRNPNAAQQPLYGRKTDPGPSAVQDYPKPECADGSESCVGGEVGG